MKREKGVTLIELMVSLLVLTIVVAISLTFFTKQLQLTTGQSRISESSQEALSAMQTLRRDIETAGYGLPWDMAGLSYNEAISSAAAYNDAPSNPPRAIIIDNANSRLVLKGTALGNKSASKHWGVYDSSGVFYNGFSGTSSDYTKLNRFVANDYAIILTAGSRKLIRNGSNWSYKYNGGGFASVPPLQSNSYLVYGISDTSSPRTPFNRIDYYLSSPASLPSNCAAGSYVLYRGIMNSSGGIGPPYYPILNCVAGFHIWLGETDSSGKISYSSSPDFAIAPSGKDKAFDERAKLKIVKVYLLVQNGKKDRNYDFKNSPEFSSPSSYNFTDNDTSPPISDGFDLSTITDWQNYRWKLIKMTVIPKNLSQ